MGECVAELDSDTGATLERSSKSDLHRNGGRGLPSSGLRNFLKKSTMLAMPKRKPAPKIVWVDDFVWPDEILGPYRVTLEYQEFHGRLEVARLTMESMPVFGPTFRPLGAAGSATPLTDLLSDLLDARPDDPERDKIAYEIALNYIRRRGPACEPGPGAARGRPPVFGLDHFEQVAAIYHAAGERAPTHAVAEALQMSKPMAARHVARARHLGLLEETTQGRVSRRKVDDEWVN